MKILHVNHRDICHPQAGGLEHLVHELNRRLIQKGHHVVLLCAGFSGGKKNEQVDGIETHRIGREEIFNFIAGPWLVRRGWLGSDIVIEHLAKVACLLPLFHPKPCLIAHVPHLFGSSIFHEVSWPIATYVYFMEMWISLLYRKTPFWAISKSTADELASRGIPANQVSIIPVGISRKAYEGTLIPTANPTILYIGRLKKYKGLVDPLLYAWKEVILAHPKAKLWIVGRGGFESKLKEEVFKLGLGENVKIWGYLDETKKIELIRSAWLLVYPSIKEGWGLSVIEAASAGIPSIASNSPGLRDAIKDGETGILVPHGDFRALSKAIKKLIVDAPMREQMGIASKIWSKNFDWDIMTEQVLELIHRTASADQIS